MKKLMTLLTLIAVGIFTMGCGDDAKPTSKKDKPAPAGAKDAAKDTAKDAAKDEEAEKDK